MVDDVRVDDSWDDDEDVDFTAMAGGVQGGYDDPFAVVMSEDEAIDDDEELPTLLFPVMNVAGTVRATAFLDGRLHQVELGASVTSMTEAELAREVTLIAGLAQRKAQAAQHALMVELMGALGYDRVQISGLLTHDVGLPTPDTVRAEIAQVFTDRYTADDD